MAEEWLTTAEAAELSGYHAEYIRQIIKAGKVQARKFGPVWQVSKQSLLDYLQAAREKGDKRWGPKE
jgi:excisionase family DNA binding protein